MSKRLRIDCHDSGLPANPKCRWIIFASQGDWSNIILSYRALPGSPFGLGELIAHCCRQGIDDVLERIHAKVLRGLPVWFNDERVDTEEVKRLLDAHDHETD